MEAWRVLAGLRVMALYADEVSAELHEKLFRRWQQETVMPAAVNRRVERIGKEVCDGRKK